MWHPANMLERGMLMLTDREKCRCLEIASRVSKLRSFLDEADLGDSEDVPQWYSFLARIRLIAGNLSNDISFVATLLAKQYLASKFSDIPQFDAADKPQGARGLDIDLIISDGRRIVGEVKTNFPYNIRDFGGNQASEFRKDLHKLRNEDAYAKFLFVTEELAFAALKNRKYASELSGIRLVLLTTGDEYAI